MITLHRSFHSRLGIDLIGLAVLAAMTAAVGAGSLAPLLHAHAAQKLAESRVEELRFESHKLHEQRADLEANAARLQEELASLHIDVEPISRLNSRLSRLTELAKRRGLTLDRIAPDAPQRATKATLVPIRMEGRGSFPSCRDWISDLRSAFPDVSVSGLQITRDRSPAAESAAFVFELVWYAAPTSQPAQPAQTAPKK